MELEKVVQDTINNMVSSGKVTEMVEKHLTATVDEIVKDALRSYGDFGKQVKEAVANVMTLDFSNVKMLDLSGVITDTIKQQLSESVNVNILQNVTNTIKELSGELDKKEYNLSEVINMFKSEAEKWDKEDSYEISLHVISESYGYTHIYFDYKADVEKYRCNYQLDLNKDGKVYAFKGGKIQGSNDPRIQSIHGKFEKFLYRLYASGAKIIVDRVDKDYEDDYED